MTLIKEIRGLKPSINYLTKLASRVGQGTLPEGQTRQYQNTLYRRILIYMRDHGLGIFLNYILLHSLLLYLLLKYISGFINSRVTGAYRHEFHQIIPDAW